jgi:protocatechuate 3,4-dioxygenase beta subunit
MHRRHLIAGLGAALACPVLSARNLAPMTEGPFYPPASWRAARPDWDADLTRVAGQTGPAQGEHLALDLSLADTDGRAIDRAEVEIWQCDALSAYHHPRVPATPGGFDPGFQGFGGGRTAADGTVAFRTIRPVPYPGRTPHIHVKLRHPSFGEVSSQLFVAGDPGNAGDFLWRRLDAEAQAGLAMTLHPAQGDGLRWQVRHRLLLPA